MPRKPTKLKKTRRGNNEGSIYRRGSDGKWVGQITLGYRAEDGKPIRKYFYANTREEVSHLVALEVATAPNKGGPVPQELIVRDFLHQWLTSFKTFEVNSRTMELYYSCERLHIAPILGDIPVSSVTPIQIQTLLYQLQSEKQLSHRTISLVRSVLIQMFDYAIDLQLVDHYPARNAKLPKQPRDPEEVETAGLEPVTSCV